MADACSYLAATCVYTQVPFGI